jgi:hypothetical protein
VINRQRIAAALAALLVLLLCGCQTGPSAADVAADRARWTAVRDRDVSSQARLEHVRAAVADDTITPQERQLLEDAFRTWDQEAPLYAMFLLVWDDKLTADEKAANAPRDAKTVLLDLLRVYGVATVQLVIGPELQAKAPAVFKLLDRDSNSVLDESELMAIDPADPVFAVVVIDTLRQLLQRRH